MIEIDLSVSDSIAKGAFVWSPWTNGAEPSCAEPNYTGPSCAGPSCAEPSCAEPGCTEPSSQRKVAQSQVAQCQVAQSQVAQCQVAQSLLTRGRGEKDVFCLGHMGFLLPGKRPSGRRTNNAFLRRLEFGLEFGVRKKAFFA